MVELLKEQYHYVRTLFPIQEEYIEPKAVVDLNNPGWVFADSPTQPKAALIWVQGNNGFYLLGTYNVQCVEELNRVVDMILIPRIISKGIKWFEFSGVSPVTDTDLKRIFKSRKLSSWQQTIYQYKETDFTTCVTPQKGQLCEIKDIGVKYPVENTEFVNNMILKNWESIEVFQEKANGYCFLIDNIVASIAITGWIAGNIHEISIETVDSHRRRGYAKICASALINCYIQQGYTPHWECETANTASAKLAEGFGFTKLSDYMCYGFKIGEPH